MGVSTHCAINFKIVYLSIRKRIKGKKKKKKERCGKMILFDRGLIATKLCSIRELPNVKLPMVVDLVTRPAA